MTWPAFRTGDIIDAVLKNTRGQIIDWADEIEKGIVAAIKEENEDCAKILDELKAQLHADAEQYSTSGGVCHASETFATAARAMELAAHRIRERCNTYATETYTTQSKIG